jgi:DNA-binding CsgD family transcriptional regulator/PAS domain-containing protein
MRAISSNWAAWAPARSHHLPLGEPDLRAFLRAIASSLGALEAVLTLHPQSEPARPLAVADTEALLSADAHQELAVHAATLVAPGQWAPHTGQLDRTTLLLDRHSWHVLRIGVTSRRGASSVVLNILFDVASARPPSLSDLQALRPMIDSYLRLWQRGRARERSLSGLHGALNAVDMGIVLIDRSMRIGFANRAAEAMFAAEEHIRRAGNSFAAIDFRQGAALQVAISHAVVANAELTADLERTRRAPALVLRSITGDRPLVVAVVSAVEPAIEAHDVAAVAYLLAPKLDASVQLEPVCRLYRLTPVEASLAAKLVAGYSLQESAEAIRVKEQTARSYLKQIFLKTGTHRQAELMRVMLSSVIPLQRDIAPAFLG